MAATAAESLQHINVVWAPLPGSQTAVLRCPVWEVCYGGSRGPGKTDTILMDFAQHVGAGHGAAWRGLIFRREKDDLRDLEAKSKRWFFQIFPAARYSESDLRWRWPTGEELHFRYVKDPDQYWGYHGQEWPFIGWEELTTWANDECYEVFKSINRSSVQAVPRKYRSSTNPWGAGHGWVKERFVDPAPPLTAVRDAEGNLRVYVHGLLEENVHLLRADPDYVRRLRAIRNPELRKAWLDGDWNVNPGGFLQGVWNTATCVVKPFPIPVHWARWRAMDWGFAKPFSIGWYCQDPDTEAIYRYRELYGYGGRADVGVRLSYGTVAEWIRKVEAREREAGVVFRNNPADTSIWAELGVARAGVQQTGASIMAERGVQWVQATKGPGSRRNGAQLIVELLSADQFKVFSTCRHWLRTVPALQPDPDDWEDVDTDMEDHAWDETRYSLVAHHPAADPPPEEAPAFGTFDDFIKPNNPRRRGYRRNR